MKHSIAFFYPHRSSFVNKDIQIFEKFGTVFTPEFPWLKKAYLPINLLRQLFFLIQHRNQLDAIMIMFGGYWSFFPTLIGKVLSIPTYIIIGGTDASYFRHLKYGNLGRYLLKWVIKKSYEWATKLLPVHEALIKSEYTYDERSSRKQQGVLSFFPNLKTPFFAIHNGFDDSFFNFEPIQKKMNHFVCVASVQSKKTFELKGFDLIIEAAKVLPNYQFTLIGISKTITDSLGNLPPNIQLFPFLSQSEFLKYLQESEFYFQLSISEGFPNALAEAMLCGCIPIVSEVSSMPEIVGDSGFILRKRETNTLLELLNKTTAFSKDEKIELSKKARNRIIENYSMRTRFERFQSLLS
ncbi:glycosyltransferase [bacterium]|nr:MAG: glycosyltransferase [bacterium]